jgi:hypothetical protein
MNDLGEITSAIPGNKADILSELLLTAVSMIIIPS